MGIAKALVIRAPGTNCDQETCTALSRVGAEATQLHANRLLESPQILAGYQLLVIPGGFSYGDDISAGCILGSQLQARLKDKLVEFRERGNLILGICNGFQVLIKAGLLPGWPDQEQNSTTLALNDSGHYQDQWVSLEAPETHCVFLSGIQRLELPVAHAEGKFVCSDETLDRLKSNRQIALRYAAANGESPTTSSANPNGSRFDIGGITDETGRVLGLMPHPERYIDFTQHPKWTRLADEPVPDGLRLFRNAVQYVTEA